MIMTDISKKPIVKLEELTRGELVKILFNVSKRFFLLKDRKSRSITFKEVGLNNDLRCDVFNISWDEKVVILEIKTCRDDFEKDKKWKQYLNYCDYFLFLCLEGVIHKSELPKEVGLIYVIGQPENPSFNIVSVPKKLKPLNLNNGWFRKIFKKLAFRKFAKLNNEIVELDGELFFNI